MQIEGRNPVYEALKSGREISVIYIQNKISKDKIKEIISLAGKRGIRVRRCSRNKLNKISQTSVHQGVIAIGKYHFFTLQEILEELEAKGKAPFFLMVNEVLYQHNLGALIRTAECAGCDGVIISKNTKVLPTTIRTSMGATEYIPIIKENIFNAIKMLNKYAIRVIGLEASGTQNLYKTNLRGPLAFIVGGENSGITKSILAKCDCVLKIPLFGKIGSLNMSNAAALALFEKVRQEKFVN